MPSGESRRNTQVAEFLGLTAFAVALMLLISLATYDPRDPVPFFKSGLAGNARNFIGPVGAFLAELLVAQLFGLAAAILPIALGLAGWRLFWCKPIEAPYTKVAGFAALLLALTAFLNLSIGTVTLHGETVRAGGMMGEILAALLVGSVGRTGSYIVLATAIVVSLILATQFSFAALLAAVGDLLSARFQALRTRWAHHAEQRRKERMRREVIRKHTQKESGTPEAEPALEAPAGPTMLGDLDAVEMEEAPAAEAALLEQGVDARRVRKPRARPAAAPEPVAAPQVEPTLARRAAARTAAVALAEPDEEDDGRAELPSPAPARVGAFALPPPSILEAIRTDVKPDKARLFERARVLQTKAGEFGVMGTVVEIHPGPVVTTYEFKPDAGVKYSRIVGLADDLALALEAESIRIDRMSGKGSVGIEIPNETREVISLREIVESEGFQRAPGRMTMALGKNVSGETMITDLATMPHLLIAGATGQGKSVGLNCMIASILMKSTPDEVRFILIDPKRLELGVYEDIPHLLCPVVTDPKIASNVLKWAVGEMEKRIRRLASEGVRNIDQFNNIVRAERTGSSQATEEDLKPLHYIVIIIDELADLMMVSSHEVEESITRLAQMARAVGIHLILATQRPSVDVITGLIKANFPSRISFRVSARVDSRTILDAQGAEHLLGKGDMLFLPPGSARLTRVHGAFVSEQEIARLTSYLRKVAKPSFDETVGKTETASREAQEAEDRDELFDEAVRFVVSSGQASTSMLQRRFRVGFSRAGRLVDMMERDGIIGPADGSKPREILVASDYYEAVDSSLR